MQKQLVDAVDVDASEIVVIWKKVAPYMGRSRMVGSIGPLVATVGTSLMREDPNPYVAKQDGTHIGAFPEKSEAIAFAEGHLRMQALAVILAAFGVENHAKLPYSFIGFCIQVAHDEAQAVV